MEKKRKLKEKIKKNWYWILIVGLIILLVVGISVFGNRIFVKKAPNQPPCTANITLACEDGTTIITQQCTEGVLINTGKICPCIRDVNVTCEDASIVMTHRCVNGTLINTGKKCPCFKDVVVICYDGNTTITHNCVNGTLISTGKACPPQPAIATVELTLQRLQTLFQKSEYFTKLPNNAAVMLSFFDGNGKMRSERFFIAGGGVMSNYAGQGYDLEFTMGDYRVPELESSNDFCATLNKIKDQQDLRVSLKNVFSVGKYLYLKSCVSF